MAIVPQPKDSDYSPTWKLEDDEPVGNATLDKPDTWPRHVEFRKAETENGTKVVWELELANGKGHALLWLDPFVLARKVSEELGRRKATRSVAALEPRERVYLDPGRKRPKKTTTGTLWPFPHVVFEHGIPEQTAEELLLSGAPADGEDDDALDEAAADEPIPEQPTDDPEGGDDVIPF